MLDDLAAGNVSNTIVQSAWVPTVRAQNAMINQKPMQALELLEAVKPTSAGSSFGNLSYSCMIPVYFRAEAYLGAKRGPLAYLEFQKLIDNRGVVGTAGPVRSPNLGQGRAQALAGSKAAARAAYQEFFACGKTRTPASLSSNRPAPNSLNWEVASVSIDEWGRQSTL